MSKPATSGATPDDRFPWPRGAAAALFSTVFFGLLLTTSRERPWADATPVWNVAESLVRRLSIAVPLPWPPSLPTGRGGRYYAVAPLLQSLVHVPGAFLHSLIRKGGPQLAEVTWALCANLAPAALAALTCVLFMSVLRGLRLPRSTALVATAALGLATTLWVYARRPYAEVLQACCFTGFVAAVIDASRARLDRRLALRLGVWAGLLVSAKLVYALCLPGAALAIAWWHRDRRQLARAAGWAAAACAPFALMILWYDWARWGNPFASGYDVSGATTGERTIWGLWGQLFSPGKSVLLYSPALALTVFALPRAARRMPRVLWALGATIAPVLLFTSGLLYWSGDYSWGPRYLVFAVPAALIPAALVIDDVRAAGASGWRGRLGVAAVAAVLAAGVAVQVLGNAFFWDAFIRIQREARNRWLGEPNTTGTPFPDFGGVCGACFEDMHGAQWLPSFQPIEGHAWLLGHIARRHDWATAEADAPWHRYTTLRLDIARTYSKVALDWWYLDYRASHRRLAFALSLAMAAGFLVSLRALWDSRQATTAAGPGLLQRLLGRR